MGKHRDLGREDFPTFSFRFSVSNSNPGSTLIKADGCETGIDEDACTRRKLWDGFTTHYQLEVKTSWVAWVCLMLAFSYQLPICTLLLAQKLFTTFLCIHTQFCLRLHACVHFRGAARPGEGNKMVDNMSHASFFFIFKLENEKDLGIIREEQTECRSLTWKSIFSDLEWRTHFVHGWRGTLSTLPCCM